MYSVKANSSVVPVSIHFKRVRNSNNKQTSANTNDRTAQFHKAVQHHAQSILPAPDQHFVIAFQFSRYPSKIVAFNASLAKSH